METKNEIIAAANAIFNKLRKEYPYRNAHYSHAVSRVLEEIDESFCLEGYGVEGIADYQYINMGDLYVETLFYEREKGFFVSCLSDVMESINMEAKR